MSCIDTIGIPIKKEIKQYDAIKKFKKDKTNIKKYRINFEHNKDKPKSGEKWSNLSPLRLYLFETFLSIEMGMLRKKYNKKKLKFVNLLKSKTKGLFQIYFYIRLTLHYRSDIKILKHLQIN